MDEMLHIPVDLEAPLEKGCPVGFERSTPGEKRESQRHRCDDKAENIHIDLTFLDEAGAEPERDLRPEVESGSMGQDHAQPELSTIAESGNKFSHWIKRKTARNAMPLPPE
jgi:hypothetical protein